mgnify:CR=1 FL=1
MLAHGINLLSQEFAEAQTVPSPHSSALLKIKAQKKCLVFKEDADGEGREAVCKAPCLYPEINAFSQEFAV